MAPVPFRVSARDQDTADTWTLTLEPIECEPPIVAPGQFMMVTAFGIGEVPISVSGPGNRPGPVVLTVRAVGAVTRAVCGATPGSVLGLRGPFGNDWPVDTALDRDVIVIAGGIGLAPLRPVVLATLERRDAFGAVSVLYGARTPDDLLYTDELEDWRRSCTVEVTVDTAPSVWAGRVGVVTKLLGESLPRPAQTSAFVCGPEIMMRFAARALIDRGIPADRIAVSMERHMDCGVGLCGHCQLGPTLICRDGPVYAYSRVEPWLEVREL
jgi:anaerobic sulfite reductase subunit B